MNPARQEPIRNQGQAIGRNEPCPCGSGKKFKACHKRGRLMHEQRSGAARPVKAVVVLEILVTEHDDIELRGKLVDNELAALGLLEKAKDRVKEFHRARREGPKIEEAHAGELAGIATLATGI